MLNMQKPEELLWKINEIEKNESIHSYILSMFSKNYSPTPKKVSSFIENSKILSLDFWQELEE
jgi:hypothetical protein